MRKLLLLLASASFAWAAIAFLTGGIDWRVAGLAIRSRGPWRPAELGVALLLVDAIVFRQASVASVQRVLARVRRLAPFLALLASLAMGVHAVVHGIFVAGGADSYGYVSQAYGWYRGELPKPQPVPLSLSFPLGDLAQAPLGYRLNPAHDAIVPTYAPGLPLMMAVLLVLGPCGPYLVVPVFAALFVWLTYLFGRRAGGPLTGLTAAIVLLISPAVLYQAVWPMSDVPAGALWTGAALASLGSSRRAALLSGALTAAGLLVRPNLPLPVFVPLAFVLVAARGRERWTRLLLFCAPVAVVTLFVSALNQIWFGAPWESGYGGARDLYSLSSIVPNLRRYPVWLWQSQSPWVLLAVLPLLPWARKGMAGRPVLLALAMVAAVFACYVPYYPFDAWWYLRFLLPGFGALAVLMACGAASLARRIPLPWGYFVAAAALALTAAHTTRFSADHWVFDLVEGESRYVYVAQFMAEKLPANAVVLAMQHSGSLRFYGGRFTLRYDMMDPEWSARVIPELERQGYHPFLLIEDPEVEDLRRRFRIPPDASLPWPLFAGSRANGIRVYDMGSGAAGGSPFSIEPVATPRCVPPRPLELHAAR